MYGNQTILQSDLVSVQTYTTIGSQIQSFFFRVVVNLLNLQKINYNQITQQSSSIHELWMLQINNAIQLQQVDLTFLDSVASGTQQNQLKMMIQSLPDILQKAFVQVQQCQCGYQESIIVFSTVGRQCPHCRQKLQVVQVPIISFSQNKKQLQTILFDENYYLNGFMTQNINDEYSVLVDFEKLQKQAVDVFILESMPKSDLRVTLKKKISQLIYLKTNKVISFIKNYEQKMQQKLGTISINCWINEKYLSQDQQRAFRQMIGVQQPLQTVASYHLDNNSTESEQIVERIQEEPEQQQVSYPKVLDFSWIIYFVLTVILLLLIIAMIILSVLIYRLQHTFSASNVIAQGTAFISLPQVQTATQASNFVSSFSPQPVNTNQINRLQAFNTPVSLFLGPSTFASLKFNQMQFSQSQFPPSQAVQPTSATPINVQKLTVGSVTTTSLLTKTAILQNQVQFTSQLTLPVIKVQSGTIGTMQVQNTTSNIINAQTLNPTNLQADLSTLNTLTSQQSIFQTANLNTLSVNQLTTSTFTSAAPFTINQPLKLENLIFENSNMIFMNSVTKSFQNVINFDYTNIQMNGNLLTITPQVSAINVISQGNFIASGTTQFGTIQVNTGMAISGTIALTNLQIRGNGTVTGQFQTNSLVNVNLEAQSFTSAQTTINNVQAISNLPLQVGNAVFGANSINFSSPLSIQSTGVSFLGQNLQFQDITGSALSGVLSSNQLQTGPVSSLTCVYQSAIANAFTATTSMSTVNTIADNYNLNIGGVSQPLIQQVGGQVSVNFAILNGQNYCSTNGSSVVL